MLAAKRSPEDDDTSRGGSDGSSGKSASTESDADVAPEKRRRRGTYHKPRPPRQNNLLAFIQLSPALQSELKKLQHVWLHEDLVFRKLNGTKCARLENKTVSLLQPGSRTPDVAATITSPATGRRRQHVVEIFAMDVDDNFQTCGKRGIGRGRRKHRCRPDRFEKRTAATLTTWKTPPVETQSILQHHFCRCEQCDTSGHPWVNVSRNELRTLWVLMNLGNKMEQLERCPCAHEQGQRDVTGTWDTHQYNKWRNFFENRR